MCAVRISRSQIAMLMALVLMAFPAGLHAQAAQDDLRATIRAELLSDPRTSNLTQAQLDAMVEDLASEAQKQGVTAHDILWRPAAAQGGTFDVSNGTQTAISCGKMPAPLCALNRAFGFDGSDSAIPIGLGIASAMLLLIIGLMFEMRRRETHAAHTTTTVPPIPQQTM